MDVEAALMEGFQRAVTAGLDAHPELEHLHPGQAEIAGHMAGSSAVARLLLNQLTATALETDRVAHFLAVTRQAVHSRVKHGTLLGLPGRGTTLFPTWQLDPTRLEVRPVVRLILEAFRHHGITDPVVIASWATTPQPEDLDGASPEGWLAKGGPEEALVIAARRAASALAQ